MSQKHPRRHFDRREEFVTHRGSNFLEAQAEKSLCNKLTDVSLAFDMTGNLNIRLSLDSFLEKVERKEAVSKVILYDF